MIACKLLLGCLLALTFALLYARHDYLETEYRDLTTLGGDVNHKARLVIRSAYALVLALVVALPELRLLALLATGLAVGCAFALPFQISLNVRRGKGWDYVGAGNTYDQLLTRLFKEGAGEAGVIISGLVLIAACAGRIWLG